MKKIWIVLKSEFIRRVRSFWFIVGTLLAPLFLILVSTLPVFLGIAASGADPRHIVVVDETGVLAEGLSQQMGEFYTFTESHASAEELRAQVKEGAYNGYLMLPASLLEGGAEAQFYSVEGFGLSGAARLERALTRMLEEHRLRAFEISDEIKEILDTQIEVKTIKLTEAGEVEDSSAADSVLGYIMGFIIYTAVFVYGAYVIQGVLEEKASHVIEVMVSSVRPFQMLMGKVLGIGAVGILQMTVWSILTLGLFLFAGSIAVVFLDPSVLSLPADASQEDVLNAVNITLPTISPSVFAWFVLFFLGGYLLYASLFAAVSSAVEQQQDAQGLLMPIYALIIIPILFIVFFVESPNSSLAVGLSMVPFFSPILMVVRLVVTEVPVWQTGLSFCLLVATFLGAMWVSSRIYRVGILMYGKKPNLKDLIRWIRFG